MKRGRGQDDNENWIGVSDLMAGIAIIFIIFTADAINKPGPPVEEFCKIMKNAEHTLETNGMQVGSCTGGRVNLVFDDQETQFKRDSSEIPERLKTALKLAIPEALGSIQEEGLDSHIESFVVEGHTSDEWNKTTSADKAYWLNMKLSQDRARKVLEYIREEIIKTQLTEQYCWIRKIGSASGLSSRDLILQRGGSVNRKKSRRIEIVILTQAEPRKGSLPSAEFDLCKKEFKRKLELGL